MSQNTTKVTIEGYEDEGVLGVRVEDAAKMLGLSPRTLNNWRSKGTGPDYSRLGGVIVYPVEGLKAYMEANRVSPSKGC